MSDECMRIKLNVTVARFNVAKFDEPWSKCDRKRSSIQEGLLHDLQKTLRITVKTPQLLLFTIN